jgi:choline kinase
MSLATGHAVILVAGEGKRLQPFTLAHPKCFAKVGNTRILDNTLRNLATAGCERVTIVSGHLSDMIRRDIGDISQGMEIRHVVNPNYSVTNSMYSLFLALTDLNESTWLVEGDVFFDSSILERTAEAPLCWYVDSRFRASDGAYLKRASDGRISNLEIIRSMKLLLPDHCKSAGILRLSAEVLPQLRTWLENAVRDGRRNDYYDLIISDHFQTIDCQAIDIAGYRWYEIDDPSDLERAREVFA